MKKRIENLPRVYGEGALFAFSGMDGETSAGSGFVCTLMKEPGFLVHTPVRRRVRFEGVGEVVHRVVTGDVWVADAGGGELVVTFLDGFTVMGKLPRGMRVMMDVEEGVAKDAVVVKVDEGRGVFAMAYGVTEMEAVGRAEVGLARAGEILEDVIGERLAVFERLPRVADAGRDELLKKCVAVMKVNTLSAEGAMGRRWSTPDRVPHKDMWLWDSVFHSLAMNFVDARLASEFLLSVLDTAGVDGMIPHQTSVAGWRSKITQPPLLAWGVWENFCVLKDEAVLAEALPKLEGYLEWDLANRDGNGNGLLEWFIEDSPVCRSGESGLDNSQRFDEAVLMDAVDFSVFAAQDMACVAKIAEVLGDEGKARLWRGRAERTTHAVHELLWSDELRLYTDRHMDGRLSGVRAVTGFLPLMLEGMPEGRAGKLVETMKDAAHFWTAGPLPSIAVSDGKWSTDMWRGSTWINMNYLVILGLRKQGFATEAEELREKTIGLVQKYYERFGVTFEFYDARDLVPPTECDRKGARREPYDIRRKYDSIRDYHWTAALVGCLLLEEAV